MKSFSKPDFFMFNSVTYYFLVLFFSSSFDVYSQRDESAISNEFIVLLNTGADIIPLLRVENLDELITKKSQVSKSPNVWLLKTTGDNDDVTLALLKKTAGIIIAQKNHR